MADLKRKSAGPRSPSVIGLQRDRQNLSSEEQRIAEEIMGERGADLGYPVQ